MKNKLTGHLSMPRAALKTEFTYELTETYTNCVCLAKALKHHSNYR